MDIMIFPKIDHFIPNILKIPYGFPAIPIISVWNSGLPRNSEF